jgi:hypothetical protein
MAKGILSDAMQILGKIEGINENSYFNSPNSKAKRKTPAQM